LTDAGLPPPERQEVADVYASARLDALRNGMVILSVFVLVALFIAALLPSRPLAAAAEGIVPAADAAAPARGP
jgi:hypothetical protein